MARHSSNKIKYTNGNLRLSNSDKVMHGVFYMFLVAFGLICLIPFWLVVAASFTQEQSLLREGYRLFPKEFTWNSYRMVSDSQNLVSAYTVTISITVVGTLLSMLVTCSMAYALSIKSFRSRSALALFIYFTMLFSGGMVPSYLLITKTLHLKNTFWVLILPAMVSAWYILLMRNFFNGLPDSLSESAKLDGANEITIMFRIILPISLPGIATISLFYALGYWNEWYNCLLYVDSNHDYLYTLQYLIQKMLENIEFVKQYAGTLDGVAAIDLPTYSYRMATVVVTIGPIILLYPFLQKYFVQGLTVGSVKG